MTNKNPATFIGVDSSRFSLNVEILSWPGLSDWDTVSRVLRPSQADEAKRLFDMADLDHHTLALIDDEPALIVEFAGESISAHEDEDAFHNYWALHIRRVMRRIDESLAGTGLMSLEAPLELSLDENYSAWVILRASIATKDLLDQATKAIQDGSLI